MDRESAVKTATDRASEAIEAAETMFADEMGATLDLSPAGRMALIETVAAAIEAAVAEEQDKLGLTDEAVLALSIPRDRAEARRRPSGSAAVYKNAATLNGRSRF